MPASIRGVVTAIDRTTGFVRAVLENGTAVSAAYGGHPPPPLSTCKFVNNGPSWLCRRGIGDRRVVLHDDFLFTGIVTGLIPWFGDTPWVVGGFSTGTIVPTGGAVGAVRLNTTALDNAGTYILKSETTLAPDGQAVWLSARVRGNSIPQHDLWVGLGTDDLQNYVIAAWAGDGPASFQGRWVVAAVQGGVGSTRFTTGDNPQDDAWNVVDLVYRRGEWVAVWIDGNGPTFVTDLTALPLSTPLAPFLFAARRPGAPDVMRADFDWIRVETFDPTEDVTSAAA